MTPLSRRLREEARVLRAAADRVWRESETLLDRATAMKREAREIEQMADDQDEIERAREHVGDNIRVSKPRRAA